MLIKWLFISLLGIVVPTTAQVIQTDRFEIPLTDNATSYEVTSLQEEGLLLHRRTPGALQDQFEIAKYDTAYTEKWHGSIPIDDNFVITHKRFYESTFYVLLRGLNYYDFQLIVLNVSTGTYSKYELRNYIPFIPSAFEVNDRAAIIGGYFNRVPIVILFDFTSLRIKVLPGLFSEVGELAQIKMYEDNTFDVLLCARYFNREKTIWIKSYTPEGDFINQLVLPTEGNKSLLYGRILRTPDNMKVVAGVFGNRNSEYSKGIFVAAVDPFGDRQVRYYNFADLENFFSYMKEKRERRVKDRINRRKSKGKNNRFNYRLLVHELIPYQDQFILLGEAFYPKYKSVDRSSSPGFFTRPGYGYGSGTDLVFDGYRYTHATLLGFHADGNLKWDNTFEINDVKTFNQEQFVKVKGLNDKLTLLYLFNNQLRTKVINGSKVLEGKSSEPLKTFLAGDQSSEKQTTLNKLEYWYDDYLFAYGVQNIVNTGQKGGQSQRSVFFINKLQSK